MILRNFTSLRAFTVYMENSLRFEISLRSNLSPRHFRRWGPWCPHKKKKIDRSEICTEVSFTPPEVMWMLIMKLPYIEVKFYPKVKSQTGLSSRRVSCKRALSYAFLKQYCAKFMLMVSVSFLSFS